MSECQKALDIIKSQLFDLYGWTHCERETNLLQELVDKATPKKTTKTQKHKWITNSDGEIDVWQYTFGEYHNGPECEICGYSFCHHCSNKYDNETCNEHDICECGQHLKGTENYYPNCGQALDWSKE